MKNRMPNIGLPLCGRPDWWVPGDDDDPSYEAEVERRTNTICDDPSLMSEIIERTADNAEHCSRVYEILANKNATDAWKARRLEALFQDWVDSASEMAAEDIDSE